MLKMWSVNTYWVHNVQIFTKYQNRFIETCILLVLCFKFSSIWDRQPLKPWENVKGFPYQSTRSKWRLHKWINHIYLVFCYFSFLIQGEEHTILHLKKSFYEKPIPFESTNTLTSFNWYIVAPVSDICWQVRVLNCWFCIL